MPINRRPTPPPEAVKQPNTVMDSLNAWTAGAEDEEGEGTKKKRVPLGYSPLSGGQEGATSGWRKFFDSESDNFNTGIGVIIVMNAVVIGLETDNGRDNFVFFEHLFNACFVVEMVTRILQIGSEYFTSPWYLFDCTLVVAGSLDLWILPALHPNGDNDVGYQFSVMRLLRILRLMRVLRVIRLFRMFNHLLLLISAFNKAIQVVLLLSVLVVIMLYALAIVATQLIGHQAHQWGDNSDDIDFWFGDIQRSMATLFFIMFGSSWDPVLSLLTQVYPVGYILPFFAGYMIVTVALAALIIGLISESLIIAQQEFKQRTMDKFGSKKKALAAEYTEELNALLEDDMDEQGYVEAVEVKTAVKGDSNLTSKLMGVGVHLSPDALVGIVDSISKGGTQKVSVDHFVDKLVNLSGNSTASAVVDVKYDIVKNRQKMDQLEAKLDAIMKTMT